VAAKKEDNVSSIFSAKMMELFEGFASVHGTHGEPTRKPDSLKWEIKSTASTVKKPVTLDLWERHLAGKYPLGVISVREDSMCRWGSIDFDVYDADMIRLIKKVVELKLPLVPCRSKSGGLHLFCFTKTFVPAATMQGTLRDLSARLGISGSEIFPKQTQILTERGDLGSWMVMPYFGGTFGGKLKEQSGLKKNGNDMTLPEFIKAIESTAVSEEDLVELSRKRPQVRTSNSADLIDTGNDRKRALPGDDYPEPDRPFGDGPPCLEQLADEKVPAGKQNNALLNMGIYAKDRYPDEWATKLEYMSQNYLDPPGRAEATATLIKSLDRKDYRYTCKNEPIHSYCNAGLCKMRPFGVGKAGDVPDLRGMTVLNTDPPLWFVNVEDKRVEVSTDELMNYTKFNIACANQVKVTFAPVKQADWTMALKAAMENVHEINVPDEAGVKGGVLELFDEFITDRRESSTVEGLVGGAPWYDRSEDKYWFRLKGFMDYLKTQGVKDNNFGRNRVTSLLKDRFTMESKNIKIKDKTYGVWGIAGKFIEKRSGPLATPTQEDAGI
jgi:hypothetical protein